MRPLGTLLCSVALLGCLGGGSAAAQVVVTQVNDEGVPAPCIGLGLGVLLVKKCTDAVAKQGFARRNELGDPGFTIGRDEQDGKLMNVERDSGAAAAGFKDGDRIVSVDGKSVRPTPGEAAAEQSFGERDQTVTLTVRHDGAERDVVLKRAPLAAVDPPKALGFMIGSRPLINWRGKYVPCNGLAGPAGLPVLAYCEHLFRPYGYVRASELGTTGLVFDLNDSTKAVLLQVVPNSPAAAANLVAGDQVLQVDGKPLTGYIWQKANMALFAKPGETRVVTVNDGTKDVTATLPMPPGK